MSKINTEFLIQFISSLSILSMTTYIPVLGHDLGLSNLEIILVAIVYGITIFLTNLIVGRLSDKIGLRKPFIIIGLLLTGISVMTFVFPANFIEFVITRIFTAVGYGIYIPTLTALVTDKKMKLGKFSSAGTAAWAVGIIFSGLIGIFWIPGIFVFSGLVVFGSGLIAFSIKEEKSEVLKYKYSSITLFWQRKRLFSAFIVRHALASAVWILWPIYLFSLGADELAIALIQLLNPVTSSIIMNKFTDKLDSKLMFNLGLIFTAMTFFGYLIAPNWYWILPVQIILGFSWGFLYVGVLRYAIESSEFDKSTVSGWINSIQSISVIIGSGASFFIIYLGGTVVHLIILSGLGSLIMFSVNFLIDFRVNSQKIVNINQISKTEPIVES